MSNVAIKTSAIAQINSAVANDLLIITRSSNGQTRSITVKNLMGNSTFDLKAANLVTTYSNTPANSTALTIQAGQIFYDSSFLYIAVANNTVKRTAISTF